MKCDELKTALSRLEPLWIAAGGSTPTAMVPLMRLLEVRSTETVAKLSTRISSAVPTATSADSPLIEEIVALVDAVKAALAESKIGKDCTLLSAALHVHSTLSIDALVEELSANTKKKKNTSTKSVASLAVVQRHCRALESALGDEAGFAASFHALETDPEATTPELIALAQQFGFARVKSKRDALKKILARQQALMTSRAKTMATGGRIAG